MFSAAHAIGSNFWRSDSDVKISFIGCAGFGFTGKILLVCFPAFMLSGVRSSQVARLAFGVARITSKSRKKAAQKRQKSAKNRT
jgi:hypothetical protein